MHCFWRTAAPTVNPWSQKCECCSALPMREPLFCVGLCLHDFCYSCRYPRPDSTVYVCGVSSEEQPPHTADEVVVEAAAVRTLQGVAGSVCKQLGEAEVLKQQACYLPCSDDGLPLIGAVPGVPGAYLATGHSCWGILNGESMHAGGGLC